MVLKGLFLPVVVRGSSLQRCDRLGKVEEEMGREPHLLRLLGNVTGPMDPSLPVGTWERVVAVKGPSLRRCGRLGKVGEEMGRELHLLRRLENVTGPMDPSPPVELPLPMRTWEMVVVVKGRSLPRCGQLEKALEAMDPVRLGHGLKLGWE